LTILEVYFKILSVFSKFSGGFTMYYGICSAGPGCAGAGPLMAIPFMIVFFMMGGLFCVAAVLFKLFLWWRVFSKAGYSGAFSLLLLAPFGTLIMLCILAFSKWPTDKQPQQQV
jgi:type III secretory pathway component EscT